MRTHNLFSMRAQLGSFIQGNKLIIGGEILAIALFPLVLTFLQLPRTIVPLFLLGWLSLWLRRKNWKEMGLCRPPSWLLVILIGGGIAVIGVFLEKAILPILLRLTGETQPQAIILAPHPGNLFYFLFLLIGVWLLAAIGEELVYRGYLLNRLIDLFGQSKARWGIGLIVGSLAFSLSHGISNRASIIGVFLIGLTEGGLYLVNRRNLWLSIVFHGIWYTSFLALFFLGVTWS